MFARAQDGDDAGAGEFIGTDGHASLPTMEAQLRNQKRVIR